jgi:hypothetical protein
MTRIHSSISNFEIFKILWKRFLTFLLTVFIIILIAEVLLSVVGKLLVLPFPLASYEYQFVNTKSLHADLNPKFGIWRQPNYMARQSGPCFDAIFSTNQFGARDEEWQRHFKNTRGVLLGDSYLEGYGVNENERASEKFEITSGIKLLNFATAGHCGPTQYRLIYEFFKDSIDHNFVLVGLNIPNELEDEDIQAWGNKKRYRPYLVGEYPDYDLVYETVSIKNSIYSVEKKLSSVVKNFLVEYSNIFHFVNYLEYQLKIDSRKALPNTEGSLLDNHYKNLYRIIFNIETIQTLAGARPVYIFFVPNKNFFTERNNETFSFLKQEFKDRKIEVLNIGNYLNSPQNNNLFLPCDVHWNKEGNSQIGEALAKAFLEHPSVKQEVILTNEEESIIHQAR